MSQNFPGDAPGPAAQGVTPSRLLHPPSARPRCLDPDTHFDWLASVPIVPVLRNDCHRSIQKSVPHCDHCICSQTLWDTSYSASEMTCIVSSGVLNSTHSLTQTRVTRQKEASRADKADRYCTNWTLCGWSSRLEQSPTGHSFVTYITNFRKHAQYTSFLTFLLHWL